MITRYGYGVVITALGLCLFGSLLSLSFVTIPVIRYGIPILLGALFLFILYFFRDPVRVIPEGENFVVSPADGKIVSIIDAGMVEYLGAGATQISIFLSPLNVHVNRIPWSGRVGHYRYIKGKFGVAYENKASENNERNEVGIERDEWKILMRQIAGTIARRIVCELKVNDLVVKGDKFGMIKFGSRMDLIIPTKWKIVVSAGEKVIGGETIIAVMPD